MKNSLFIIALLLVLLLGNVFTVYKYLKLQKNASEIVTRDQETIANLNEEIAITRGNFQQSLSWQYHYEGQSIQLSGLVDQNGVVRDLQGMAKKYSLLVYRIPDLACDACYDNVTLALKEMSKDVDSNRIVVIVPVKELRSTVSSFSSQGINITLLAAQQPNVLGFELEKEASPFFFIMNSELVASHVFIPHKNGAEITGDYLALVKRKILTTI